MHNIICCETNFRYGVGAGERGLIKGVMFCFFGKEIVKNVQMFKELFHKKKKKKTEGLKESLVIG